jgi:hypothetical protein
MPQGKYAKSYKTIGSDDSDLRFLQNDMGDGRAMADFAESKKREKSPATIQNEMAKGTRKVQAASAKAKAMAGKTPASPMRKLLKIK